MGEMQKAIIGITANTQIVREGSFPGMEKLSVNQEYMECVHRAGGIAVVLPAVKETGMIQKQMELVDGILLSGGGDLASELYNEAPQWEQGYIRPEQDYYELKLVKMAEKMKKPVLGICRGIQVINVAFGGTLYQDLKKEVAQSIKHDQSAPRHYGSHEVKIKGGGFLGACLPEKIFVNSYHHQAIKKLAAPFRAVAWTSDGIVEAIEYMGKPCIVGVQWHPEMMASHEETMMRDLFDYFVHTVERNLNRENEERSLQKVIGN